MTDQQFTIKQLKYTCDAVCELRDQTDSLCDRQAKLEELVVMLIDAAKAKTQVKECLKAFARWFDGAAESMVFMALRTLQVVILYEIWQELRR